MNNSYSGKCLDQHTRNTTPSLSWKFPSLQPAVKFCTCILFHFQARRPHDWEGNDGNTHVWQNVLTLPQLPDKSKQSNTKSSRLSKMPRTCQQRKEPEGLKSSLSLSLHSETLQPFHNQYPMLMASDFEGKVRKKLGHLNRRTECLPAT